MSRFPRRFATAIAIALFVAWTSPVARAELDAEASQKYRLDVVLSVANHRMLTDVFKLRLQRELRDSLQGALGDMATVTVVTEHPLLKEIEAKGMEAGLDAAAGQRFPGKAHFVRVYYADGRYWIRTRQLDGMTGLVNPFVRREETTDPLYVARITAQLVGKDFGPVGTIQPQEQIMALPVTFKAGKLGRTSDWVHKGDVFTVVQIGSGQRVEIVPWTLLQAEEAPNAEGVCRCRVLQRYKRSLAGGTGILGYRCLRLATTRAPLRLRLVDEKSRRPLSEQSLTISRTGFDAVPDEQHASDADGAIATTQEYEHVAFVKVMSGSEVRARLPIPVLDGRAVVVPVNANPEAEARGQLDLRRRQWLGKLYESLLVVDDLFKQLNKLVEAKEHDAAMKTALAGLDELKADLIARTEEMKGLRLAGRDLGQDKPDLADGEQRIQEMQARSDELQRFADNLKVIKQAGQRRAALLGMAEQARLFEGEAEFGKAIDTYKKIVEQAADEPAVKQAADVRRAALEEAWTTRDNPDVQRFVFKTWLEVKTPAELKRAMEEAQKAFRVCRDAGDRLTPRMLLKANLAHATRLKKHLDSLQPKDREDDRREAEAIAAAAEELSKLTEDVSTYLRAAAKKAPAEKGP